MPEQADVTQLLEELTGGDRAALDQVVSIVYDELRAIAHRQLRAERAGHTLGTTALVHEAYVKLVGIERIEWLGRAHFFAIAARAMRRILVDSALAAKAAKRGGGRMPITLERLSIPSEGDATRLLEIDEAIHRLEALNERHARIVECRFFAGMSIEETAGALELSPATVKRDWALARAWLNRELSE